MTKDSPSFPEGITSVDDFLDKNLCSEDSNLSDNEYFELAERLLQLSDLDYTSVIVAVRMARKRRLDRLS